MDPIDAARHHLLQMEQALFDIGLTTRPVYNLTNELWGIMSQLAALADNGYKPIDRKGLHYICKRDCEYVVLTWHNHSFTDKRYHIHVKNAWLDFNNRS